MLRILILDDDPLFGKTLERSLMRNQEFTCEVATATTDLAAYELVEHAETPFDVFLVDQRLGPGPDGISVLQELLQRSPSSEAVVFASLDLDSGMEAYRAGAYRYLHKPFSTQELIMILRSLREWRNTRSERDGLRILAEIAELAQRAHDPETLAALIVRGACRFGFGRARLWRLDEVEAMLIGLSQFGDDACPSMRELRIPIAESPYMSRVFETRETCVFQGEELGPTYMARRYPRIRRPEGEWVSLPLCLGDRILGILSIDHSRHARIRSDQLIELNLLAQHAAAALERVQLAEQERRRRRELELLASIGSRITNRAASGDLDALLADVHRMVSQLIDVRNFAVVLRDDNAGQLEYRLLVRDSELRSRKRSSQNVGLVGALIADNTPLLLQDETAIRSYRVKRSVGRRMILPPPQCFLGVPLQVDGQAIGALVALSTDMPHVYTPEHLRLLKSVAAQVAGAIQVTLLKEAADRHTARLELLQRANEDLLRLGQTHEGWLWNITLTLTTASYGLAFNRAALFLLDRDGLVLKGEVGIGQLSRRSAKQRWRADHLRGMTFDTYLKVLTQGGITPTETDNVVRGLSLALDDAALFRQALDSRSTCVVHANDSGFPACFRQQLGDTTYAVVPLLAGEKRLGVVVVDNIHNGEQLEAMRLRELETLLAQVALVYENVRQRRANDRLIEVSHLVLAQVANLSLREILNRISTAAQRIAEADSISIHPLLPGMPPDEPAYDVKNIGHSGLGESVYFRGRPSPTGLTLHVLQMGEPLAINDVRTFMWNRRPLLSKGSFIERHAVRAFLAAPIRDAMTGEPTGVFFLNYNAPQTFGDQDVRLARWLAELAGSAIRTCRAEQEVIESRDAAESLSRARGRELEILQRVLETALKPAIDPTHHQQVVARALLTAASDLLYVDETQVALALREWEARPGEQPGEIRRQYYLDTSGQLATDRREAVYTGITGEALRLGEDILIDDVTEERWAGVFRPRHEGESCDEEQPTRSELDVLISLEGHQILGLFNLESPRVGAFIQSHHQTLRRLAAVGALALNGVRRQNNLLNVLHVAQAMILATDVNTTLNEILHAAGALANGVSAITIWYKDSETSDIIPGPTFGIREELKIHQDVPKSTSVLSYVMTSEEPIWAETIDLDSPLYYAFVPREGIVSAAAFPLCVSSPAGNEIVGALFFNYREHHTFSREEHALLPLLATIAAASVRDALRLRSLQDERRRLDAITRITAAVGTALEIDEILRRVMRVLSELFPGTSPALLTYNNVRESLEFHPAALEYYQIEFPNEVHWLDINGKRSIACRVAKRAISLGKPVMENIRDVHADANYLATISTTRSELCRALMSVGESPPQLLGVLVLESEHPNAFDVNAESLMKGIGPAISTALDRAYRSAQLRFASSVMTATAWVHEIAHDINNEIGTIRRQAYFLGQQIGTPPSARCYIDQIDASAGRLAEYARAPKLDNARLICLNYWLQNYVTQIVDHSRRSADISYRFDFSACSPQVYVPEVLLERAVRHLVRNALEAMGITGRLTVRTLCNERDVEVRIANTGPDIPKDVRQKLFFGQVTTKNKERQVDGGGLGLLFVRWAVEAMKGKVYLLSAPGDEVTFAFKLPLVEVVEEKGLLI